MIFFNNVRKTSSLQMENVNSSLAFSINTLK